MVNSKQLNQLKITHGHGHFLVSEKNGTLFDFESGHGAVFLGHCDPAINQALSEQLQKVWAVSGINSSPLELALYSIQKILPNNLTVHKLYNTGMEAIEFSMRVASISTGKYNFIAFSKSMHGKSLATSNLSWDSAFINVKQFHQFPFANEQNKQQLLINIKKLLVQGSIAAVFVEPIQGSNLGSVAPIDFLIELQKLCHHYHALCIYDETLTGLYRTGPCFFSDNLPDSPDILIFSKSLGNGFPVAAIALSQEITVSPDMLPGSTFSNNPLAATAVAKTLEQLTIRVTSAQIMDIGKVIKKHLANFDNHSIKLNGRGALWVLKLPNVQDAIAIQQKLLIQSIFVARFGNCLRLLPQAEVELKLLTKYCLIIYNTVQDQTSLSHNFK